ncbi:MAG: glutathione S-transferase family protein [Minicystis sp.]
MSDPARVLYQFPVSHFCEKTRWNLDAKGLAYSVKNLLPGLHQRTTRKLSGVRTVPMLVDRGKAVGDSAVIALYLEQTYPARPLLPVGEAERARVLELEAWFGKQAGRAIRQWMYGELVRKRGAATTVFLEGYPASLRGMSWLFAPLFELGLRKQYRLDETGIARARATLDEVFDRLEKETDRDPARYLSGDALSIADIAAASLIGPLVAPIGSPWASLRDNDEVPAPIRALRASLSTRPGWAWIEARYRDDRRPRA